MTQALLTRLGEDHKRIEKVLNLIERELNKFNNDDEEENLIAVRDALEYMQAYPDAIHHPIEERMFAVLGQLSTELISAAEQQTIETLQAQHTEILNRTKALQQDVDNILNDVVCPIERLMLHLKAYVDLQREHMQTENSILFPLAQRCLGSKDWALLEAELNTQTDPLFDGTFDHPAADQAQLNETARFNNLYLEIVDELD